MSTVSLERGRYWGESIACRAEGGVLMTLCRYEANREFPVHAHEYPGLFFLVTGDHEETDHRQSFRQPAASGVWHPRGFAHSTRVGPRGMIGLNISIQNPDFERPSDRVFAGPSCAFAGLRVLSALKQGLPPLEVGDLIWELLADTLVTAHVARDAIDSVRSRILEEFRGSMRVCDLARDAGYHPVYLARAYRDRYGTSITEHLHELRLGEALAMMADGEAAGKAAVKAGFTDQPHMNRTCRRYFGASPLSILR